MQQSLAISLGVESPRNLHYIVGKACDEAGAGDDVMRSCKSVVLGMVQSVVETVEKQAPQPTMFVLLGLLRGATRSRRLIFGPSTRTKVEWPSIGESHVIITPRYDLTRDTVSSFFQRRASSVIP